MFLNCGVGEDSWESLGQQGDPTSPSWIFTGRTDVEAETPILWPPYVKSWLTGKDPYAGKDWGQEQNGMTEDEMVGWHHRLNGYEFGWTPGVGDAQGGLACCCSWGHKESDMTEWLNGTETGGYWLCLSIYPRTNVNNYQIIFTGSYIQNKNIFLATIKFGQE